MNPELMLSNMKGWKVRAVTRSPFLYLTLNMTLALTPSLTPDPDPHREPQPDPTLTNARNLNADPNLDPTPRDLALLASPGCWEHLGIVPCCSACLSHTFNFNSTNWGESDMRAAAGSLV